VQDTWRISCAFIRLHTHTDAYIHIYFPILLHVQRYTQSQMSNSIWMHTYTFIRIHTNRCNNNLIQLHIQGYTQSRAPNSQLPQIEKGKIQVLCVRVWEVAMLPRLPRMCGGKDDGTGQTDSSTNNACLDIYRTCAHIRMFTQPRKLSDHASWCTQVWIFTCTYMYIYVHVCRLPSIHVVQEYI